MFLDISKPFDIQVDWVAAAVATCATLSLMWTWPLEQAVQRALATIPPLQRLSFYVINEQEVETLIRKESARA